MKGAIGNALIMNMVITFMFIFFSLLIGSMAYSKAYKTKNYLINLIDETEISGTHDFNTRIGNPSQKDIWDSKANEYLRKIGYPLSSNQYNNCPAKEGYNVYIGNGQGRYDYCIYRRGIIFDSDNDPIIRRKYNYMVLVYMKFDFPVVGNFIKIPITGETKAYTVYK